MIRIASSSLALSAGLALASTALGGGDIEYVLLPGVGGGIDISDDGTVVLMGDGFGNASLWREGEGITPLGAVALGPNGLSGDGTTAVASISFGPFNYASQWTEEDGWQQVGENLDSCDASVSSAWSVSADGSIVTGLVWDGCKARAARWIDGDLTILDHLTDQSSRASAVSDDGSLMGGWQQLSFWAPCIWYPDGTQELLAPDQQNVPGEVRGINADGTVAVGQMSQQAFTWTADDGMQDLAPVTGGWATTLANAVSADGSVVVGWTGGFPLTPKAAIWTPETGGIDLEDYLEDNGINVAGVLHFASAVTPDGRTIVGQAFVSNQERTFIVRLPGPDCPADLDGDGRVDGADLGLLLGAWGGRGSGDLDGSGTVDGADLGILLGAWGDC